MSMSFVKIILLYTLFITITYAQINPTFELKIHQDVIDTLAVKDGYIYSGSYDGYVKRTDLKTNETINLTQQDDWIRSLLIINDELIVAGNNGTIIGINLLNKKQTWTIYAHKGWITGLTYINKKLVSISMDEDVKVWDIPTQHNLYRKKIYGSNKHFSLCTDKDRIIIGSTEIFSSMSINKDYHVKKIFSYGLSTVILSCTSTNIDSVMLGFSNGDITKIKDLVIQRHVKIHQGAVKALVNNRNEVYSASDDGSIIQSDINTLNKKNLIYNSDIAVSALYLDNDFLYAGFADGTIKMFDLKEVH